MQVCKVKLDYERSTKGTHVYSTMDDTSPISTLYLKRSGMPSGPAERIEVTVETTE